MRNNTMKAIKRTIRTMTVRRTIKIIQTIMITVS